MKKYAIIVAGGLGLRMGTAVPKQFLSLNGRAVLWYTLETFLAAYADMEIVLVVPAVYQEMAMELVGSFGDGRAGRIRLVSGGDTRFHSVRNGLELLAGNALEPMKEPAVIFVHDGVRCLVSQKLVHRCYEQAVSLGSAIPVIGCRDSVRLVGEESGSKPIDRSRIRLVQTPQTFRSELLLNAYKLDHQEAFTDEATVVELSGSEVYLIEGEEDNIKITTPVDLAFAGQLLSGRG